MADPYTELDVVELGVRNTTYTGRVLRGADAGVVSRALMTAPVARGRGWRVYSIPGYEVSLTRVCPVGGRCGSFPNG